MIHKAQVDSNFVVIPNGLAQHRGISFELRGFLLYILSKPVHWSISAKDIQNEGRIGRDKVYSLIKEGIDAGYVRKINRTDKGKFAGVEYEVFPSVQPFPEKPDMVLPDTANTDYIKERDIEKKESIKDSPGNDLEVDYSENNLTEETHEWDIEAFEIWWRAFPKLVNKKKTKVEYMKAMKKTDCATLLKGAEEYARQNKDTALQYIQAPHRWLADERWEEFQPQPKKKYIVGGMVKELDDELAREIGAVPVKGYKW
jgi:hypothetical protein